MKYIVIWRYGVREDSKVCVYDDRDEAERIFQRTLNDSRCIENFSTRFGYADGPR